MHRAVLIFAGVLLVLTSSAQADAGLRLFERGRHQYRAHRNVSVQTIKRRAYLNATDDLRQFLERYPGHGKCPDALFNLGRIYGELATSEKGRDAAARSLHYYRKLVREFPRSKLADDALYEVGTLCRDVFGDQDCAKEAFSRIRKEYAAGDMAARLSGRPVKMVESVKAGLYAQVGTARIEKKDDAWILHLPVSQDRSFTAKILPANSSLHLPERFYLDIPQARLFNPTQVDVLSSTDPVHQIRYGQNTETRVRVVLDLAVTTKAEDVRAYSGAREILVKVPRTPISTAQAQSSSPSAAAKPSVVSMPLPVKPKAKRRFRVIIDPGHGGHDPGAIGPRGTREKDIVLALAKILERELRKYPAYDVFMTRRQDRFISLAERTRVANALDGDLFVSIHTDASPKRSARGISTWFLDNNDDKESLRVAMRENKELGLSQKESRNREKYFLELMKASMVKNFHTVQSTEAARRVQDALLKHMRRKFRDIVDHGVRSAGFYVLTGATMPAILIETSFISNRKEEKRLRSRNYQSAIARAIAKGIDEFLCSSVGQGDHTALYRH